jgi:hypothetical protein
MRIAELPLACHHCLRARLGFKLFWQYAIPQSAFPLAFRPSSPLSISAWFQALSAAIRNPQSAFPLAFRPSPPLSISAWFQALSAISQSAFRNPHFLRISSRLSPVATALDLGLVSSSFGNFAFRNPHFLRISSRLSPVATALDLGLVSSSFGNFAIRNPQSAIRISSASSPSLPKTTGLQELPSNQPRDP